MKAREIPELSAKDIKRFEAKIDKNGANGCWLWLVSTRNTYGCFKLQGKLYSAHRIAHTIWIGRIRDGLQVDHLCGNRLCVNPAHLEAVTQLVNIQRGHGGDLHRNKTHCPKGHPYAGDNLRMKRARQGRDCVACDNARDRTAYNERRRELARMKKALALGRGQGSELNTQPFNLLTCVFRLLPFPLDICDQFDGILFQKCFYLMTGIM